MAAGTVVARGPPTALFLGFCQCMEIPLVLVVIVCLLWVLNHWQLHLWATGDVYDGKINFIWYKRVQDRA